MRGWEGAKYKQQQHKQKHKQQQKQKQKQKRASRQQRVTLIGNIVFDEDDRLSFRGFCVTVLAFSILKLNCLCLRVARRHNQSGGTRASMASKSAAGSWRFPPLPTSSTAACAS